MLLKLAGAHNLRHRTPDKMGDIALGRRLAVRAGDRDYSRRDRAQPLACLGHKGSKEPSFWRSGSPEPQVDQDRRPQQSCEGGR